MDFHNPTADDVANLLLLCCTTEELDEFCLSEKSKTYFVNEFYKKEYYYQVGFTAYALYFANRSIANFKKSSGLLSTLYVPPVVIYRLTEISKNYEFLEAEKIFSSIRRDEKLKPTKAKKDKTAIDWKPYKEKARSLLKEGKRKDIIIKTIGAEIEAVNKLRRAGGKKPICTNSGNDRPSNRNLKRRLLP